MVFFCHKDFCYFEFRGLFKFDLVWSGLVFLLVERACVHKASYDSGKEKELANIKKNVIRHANEAKITFSVKPAEVNEHIQANFHLSRQESLTLTTLQHPTLAWTVPHESAPLLLLPEFASRCSLPSPTRMLKSLSQE